MEYTLPKRTLYSTVTPGLRQSGKYTNSEQLLANLRICTCPGEEKLKGPSANV